MYSDKHIGSTFDSFLEEVEILNECIETAKQRLATYSTIKPILSGDFNMDVTNKETAKKIGKQILDESFNAPTAYDYIQSKTYFPPNADTVRAVKEAELLKKQNTLGLSDLFNQSASESDKFKDALTALADAIDDESGKDPAGLMWMFSVKEWRWKIVGWLFVLINWIDTE